MFLTLFTCYQLYRYDELKYNLGPVFLFYGSIKRYNFEVLSKSNYTDSLTNFKCDGIYSMNKRRKLVMRQFGGTIGPSRYPLFINDMKNDK